jgi:hypothetical protein
VNLIKSIETLVDHRSNGVRMRSAWSLILNSEILLYQLNVRTACVLEANGQFYATFTSGWAFERTLNGERTVNTNLLDLTCRSNG